MTTQYFRTVIALFSVIMISGIAVRSSVDAAPVTWLPQSVLTVTAFCEGAEPKIVSTWTQVPNAVKYTLSRNTPNNLGWRRIAIDLPGLSYTDSALLDPGLYQYQVRADSADGISSYSYSKSASLPICTVNPPPPSSVAGISVSSTLTAVANLIKNGSVEIATPTGAPENWFKGGWGINNRTFTYPVPGVDGAYAAKVSMTSRTSGDAKWYFDDVNVAGGALYALTHAYKADVSTELLARYQTLNGVQYQYLGAVPPASNWTTAIKNILVPANASAMTIFHVLYSVGSLEVDAFNLIKAESTTAVPTIPNPPAVNPLPPPPSLFPSFPKKEWGAYTNSEDLASFEATIGKPVSLQATFIHWGKKEAFPSFYGSTLRDKGKTLVIFWEAMDYNISSVMQPAYNYDAVNAGNWDSYITEFAKDAKAYAGPVILIPFSEMNGNWSPWSGVLNGNTPQKHIQAYQRIRNLFISAGATNVKFGWAPNNVSVPNVISNQMELYYPGSAFVDYVGLDGFNFANPWVTFSQIFADPLLRLKAYQKPVYIFSFASSEGLAKAGWITDALSAQIPKYPEIKGWVWFNENKERDWRIWSDSASLSAFKNAFP